MNKKERTIYCSAEPKSSQQAISYTGTHESPHRFLAYNKLPFYIQKYVQGSKALDFGSGTGSSSSFLYDLGFDVTGIDTSENMLKQAQANFPHINFFHTTQFQTLNNFDLVFSSFVLFELGKKSTILEYLDKSASFLKKNGTFVGITGSEELYSTSREWMAFNAKFPENHDIKSGEIAKLALMYPPMEFYDYYWKQKDYFECFKESKLNLIETIYPLGSRQDPYAWKDELTTSPFVIFIAKKI